jgi:O-antigen/teichoic acid export membrane protein
MSSIYRNILVLVSGSILARLIGILSIPIITRLYSPSDMGVLTTFISITGILVAFTSLRYIVVIPLPRTQTYALNASVLCFIILSVVSSILFIITLFFHQFIFDLLNLSVLNKYWYLLSVSVFLFGLVEILNAWAVRHKKFKLMSRVNVFQSFIGASGKIFFGLFNINFLGLLVGQILVQAGSVLTLLKFYFSEFDLKKIKFKKILFIVNFYSDIPKFRLPSQVLLSLCVNMPILFFSSFFGVEVTGQIGLAMMVLNLPISLIGQTIGQAFYGEIASIGKKKPHQIKRISEDVLKKLIFFSLVPFIILLIFGEDLFKFVFGPVWSDAGLYARIMSLYLITNLVSSPLVNILNVYSRNSLYLWLNLTRFILLIGIFSISLLFEYSIVNVLILYSILLSAHYVCIIFMIFRVMNNEVMK